MADTAEVTRGFLLYFLLPLWIAAGLADWICHRVSHIENTSGTPESLIHSLMLTEAGIALLAGLLLQINALVIAVMLAAWCAHELTAMWDVRYATSHRRLAPIEQNIHSFLDMIPMMAVSFVVILHWGDFLSLLRIGVHPADFSLRRKIGAVPSFEYTTVFLATAIALIEIPYAEELFRCRRAERSRSRANAPQPGSANAIVE
jgi:hypothetical protein